MTTEPPVTEELACEGRDSNGRLCSFSPVFGDSKCAELHGGKLNSRQQRRRRNMLEHYADGNVIKNIEVVRRRNGMPHIGDPIEIDPGVALLAEVHRTVGHVQWLAEKVRSLREDDMVWGRSLEVDEGSVGDMGRSYQMTRTERKAEINKWYDLYERERKHLAQISAAAIRAGVEERRVRLAERSVDVLEAAITAALQDLGVDPYSTRARQAIGNRLREALEGTQGQQPLSLAPEPVPVVIEHGDYWESRSAEEEF